jgi:hypothetical protein
MFKKILAVLAMGVVSAAVASATTITPGGGCEFAFDAQLWGHS